MNIIQEMIEAELVSKEVKEATTTLVVHTREVEEGAEVVVEATKETMCSTTLINKMTTSKKKKLTKVMDQSH